MNEHPNYYIAHPHEKENRDAILASDIPKIMTLLQEGPYGYGSDAIVGDSMTRMIVEAGRIELIPLLNNAQIEYALNSYECFQNPEFRKALLAMLC